MDLIKEFFMNMWTLITNISVSDVIDILFVTIVLFATFRFIRDRRAGKLIIGVAFLLIIQFISRIFNLTTVNFFLSNFFEVGVIALIILFQPEFRSALEKVGSEPGRRIKFFMDKNEVQRTQMMIEYVCSAACQMAKEKTGALIVIERKTKIGEYINTGTVINADPTDRMIENIFFKNAPLHDGAMVIRENRLYAAGCTLPMSQNEDFKDLGTRHLAAVGMSEQSDAVVIVVSEQTGIISVALNGTLMRNLDYVSLKRFLTNILVGQNDEKTAKAPKNRRKKDRAKTEESEPNP